MLIKVFGIWLMPYTILALQQSEARTVGFVDIPVKCTAVMSTVTYGSMGISAEFKGHTCDEVAAEINKQLKDK